MTRGPTIRETPEHVKSGRERHLHRRFTLAVATKAVLTLRMSCRYRPDTTRRMADETVLFQLNSTVGQVGRNRWIVVSRARQQDKKDNDRNHQSHEDEVGRLGLEPHDIYRAESW
jgi:hypothetical protein